MPKRGPTNQTFKTMKNLILLAFLPLVGCLDLEEIEPVSLEPSTSYEYWGCWTEATGKAGVYDLGLTENPSGLHTLTFGTVCGVDTAASMNIGFFRNDTLILDNGDFEFWGYIANDTLVYSAYAQGATTERFVKDN